MKSLYSVILAYSACFVIVLLLLSIELLSVLKVRNSFLDDSLGGASVKNKEAP